MSVETSAAWALHQFRKDIQDQLGVDGYFTGFGQVTGDGTGGHARITLIEPDDGSLPYRAVLLHTVGAEKSATVGNGALDIIGKSGGSQQVIETQLLLTGLAAVDGTRIRYYAAGAGSLSEAAMALGWMLPSFDDGVQRCVLDFYWPNDAGMTVWTAKCYGYYYLLR